MAGLLLSIFDYIVFSVVLLVSVGIGIFYSFRQKTSSEYLHGEHQMSLAPVSISLVVSYISAFTMQGLPAEVFVHGIGIGCTILAMWGVMLVAFTFLPIYYIFKPTSVCEYLEKRYCSKVPRIIASFTTILVQTVFCGFTLYGPAAAIESMSGIPTNYSIVVIAVVCTSYTALGGLRGVMWTDVFQAFIMVAGFIIVIILACVKMGVSVIWEELQKHGRTEISFSPNMFVRNSFWICLIFLGINWYCLFIGQTAMVRYTSLPTLKQAKISILLGGTGVMVLMFIAVSTGAVVFAYYSRSGCDPLASGEVYSSNQVVPYFVVNVVNYPGIPGLFLAATVASSLSSISSSQTSIVAIFWKDVMSYFLPKATELKKTIIMRLTVIVTGLVAIGVAFLAKYSGETLYNLGFAILDVMSAPVNGMFILGALFSFPGVWSALIGWFCSVVMVGWISIGRLIHGTNWKQTLAVDELCNATIGANNLSLSYDGYEMSYTNVTSVTPNEGSGDIMLEEIGNSSGAFYLYSLSSYANPAVALVITIVVGLVISLIPALRQKNPVEKSLLFPQVRRFVKETEYGNNNMNKEMERLAAL